MRCRSFGELALELCNSVTLWSVASDTEYLVFIDMEAALDCAKNQARKSGVRAEIDEAERTIYLIAA